MHKNVQYWSGATAMALMSRANAAAPEHPHPLQPLRQDHRRLHRKAKAQQPIWAAHTLL